jgi:hypothetical protein
LPNRATDRLEHPSLGPCNGAELRLSGSALVDLMRAVLTRGRLFRFCARGSSMSPFIRDGDVITIAPLQPRSRAKAGGVGQVVAFVNPASQRLVVHRVVGRREAGFVLQGDNMQGSVVDRAGSSDVIGRVVRIERGRRRVWLGLGPERYVIAVLSQAGMLLPFLRRVGVLARFLRRRHNDGN